MQKIIILLMSSLLLLNVSGCRQPGQNPKSETGSPETVTDDTRVSVFRQGLSTNFVLSETGIYCLREEDTVEMDEQGNPHDDTAKFIYYCDKDSDTFVKLCGRADCRHNDHTCDAWLPYSVYDLGYYEDHLYYMDTSPDVPEELMYEILRMPDTLYRMDRTGRNREEMTQLYGMEEIEKINDSTIPYYSLGYLILQMGTETEEGRGRTRRYGALDQREEFRLLPDPKPDAYDMTVSNTDKGKLLLTFDRGMSEEAEDQGANSWRAVYSFDPKENTAEPLGEIPVNMTGYQTLEGVIYVENGIVSRWDYQTKQSEKLFETDYTDADVLFGFPDCMMIVNQFSQKKQEDVYHIREVFYDWDYRYLGECTIDLNPDEVIQLPDGRVWAYTLFGETKERILFCKHWHVNVSVPAYYIEKSDFGTGEIRLHEYHFPEE